MSAAGSKIILGVVAGLVAGIGGSIAYVKLSDHPQPQKIVQVNPPAASQASPVQPPTLPDAGSTDTNQNASPAPPAEPKPARADLRSLGHKFTRNPKPDRPLEPQQAAQNDFPEQPAPQTAANATPGQPDYAPSPAASAPPPRPAVQEPTSAPQAPPPPPPVPRVVTLNTGTKLVVRLMQTISTKDAQPGDTFRGTLDSPIVRNGAIIAEKGSAVQGHIVAAERPGHVERHSDLQLQLTQINTSDGQQIAIQTSILDKQGQGNTKRNAEKVSGGAVLGAIIGAIAGGGKGAAIGAGAGTAAGAGGVLVTRGKDVELPSESELTFQLSQPVTITEQLH